MAVELASAYVQLVPSAKGIKSAIAKELDVDRVAANAGESAGREMSSSFERSTSGIGKTLAKVAAGAAVALGAAGTAVAGFGLKAAGDLQQTSIAFEGILGSGEKAQAFLQELQQFAAKTPFEFPELATAAKNLLAVGFTTEDVLPVMTKLGNVAATLGVGGDAIEGVVRALGQMKGKGKASAEELQQISEQIPGFSAIGAIADSMGISVQQAFDLMAAGAIPADQAIQAILQGMEKFPGAAGAMERQSQTLNGVLSTLKDTLTLGLVQGLAPVLPAITDALNGAAPIIGQVIGSLGATFGRLIEVALPVLGKLLPVISKIADVIGNVLGDAFEALAPTIDVLAPVFGDIISTLGDILTPIIKALAPIITTLALTFGALWKTLKESGVFDKLVGVVEKLLEALQPVIAQIGKAFVEALVKLMPSLLPLVDAIVELADALIPLIPLWVQINTAFIQLLPVLTPLIALIADGLTIAIRGLTEAIKWVRDNWGPVWDEISGFVEGAWNDVIKPTFDDLVEVGKTIMDGIQWAWENIGRPVFEAVGFVIGLVIGVVRDILKPIWDGLFDALKTAWDNVGAPAFDAIKGALGPIVALAQRLADLLDGLFGGRGAYNGGPAGDGSPFGAGKTIEGATGGIVTRPTFATIGEAGPEAVIPLNRTAGSYALPTDLGSLMPAADGGMGGVMINYNGPLDDPAARTRAIFRDLDNVRVLARL